MCKRSSFGSEAWLVDLIWNWIARLRGKPSLKEIDEDLMNMDRYEQITRRYSQDSWRKLQETFPALKALVERASRTRQDSVDKRTTIKDIVQWFHDHENEL